MSMTFRAGVALFLSAMLLSGCAEDSSSKAVDEVPSAEATSGCTEHDGAWFGRSADGAVITSQTREACEERVGE